MAMYRILILNLQRGTPGGSDSSKAVYSIKASIVNFSTESYRGMCFRVKSPLWDVFCWLFDATQL